MEVESFRNYRQKDSSVGETKKQNLIIIFSGNECLRGLTCIYTFTAHIEMQINDERLPSCQRRSKFCGGRSLLFKRLSLKKINENLQIENKI